MDFSALDDLQLLGLLQNGHEEAFAEIYHRYWKNIYTQALNYTKSEKTAQDIVQDVFLKLWTGRDNLQHIQELRPYLFIVARNRIINSLRNRVYHSPLDAEELIEEQTFLPEQQLSYKESLALFHKAMELLPAQQKTAYQLSRIEGLTYEAIAQQMGVSRLTVRNHITRAIAFIRNYLTENAVHIVFVALFLFVKKS